MKPITLKMKCALALVIGGIMATGPVMADKPSWAGSDKGDKHDKRDKGDKHDKGDKRDRDHYAAEKRGHFEERHRTIVHEHYAEQFRRGRCPPGLAKKDNGCMPPGQAKKWQIGQPLPHDVIYYTVPQPLVAQIGQPPSGYRYVRVGNDILLIGPGTGMVIDAIQNLGR